MDALVCTVWVKESVIPPNKCNQGDPHKTFKRPREKDLNIIQNAMLFGNHSTAVYHFIKKPNKSCKENHIYFGRTV